MKKADIGLIGLAVMGENLVLNMESKGFTVAVYNRTADKVKNFVEGRAAGKNIIGTYSLEELAANLEKIKTSGKNHGGNTPGFQGYFDGKGITVLCYSSRT